MQPRETTHLWVGRVAALIGLIFALLAVAEGLAGTRFLAAAPSTLLLCAIAAFLAALWIAVDEIIEAGLKSK
ncbi:MAG: hypothetical protein M1136_12590 [Chloroflexi bacterium]|nr:hypothetical protein [Chloroflexota bacterium]MCL5076461.1 hypothetical protein [Chloroflexota bacterium]